MLSRLSVFSLLIGVAFTQQFEGRFPEYEGQHLFQPSYPPFREHQAIREPIVHHKEPVYRHHEVEEHDLDYNAYPKYSFDYSVKDPHTGDDKEHWETRDGDNVKGSYALTESDGTKRVVEYEADDKNGFNAVVHKIGTPHELPPAAAYRPRRPQHEPPPHFSQGFEQGGFVPLAPY